MTDAFPLGAWLKGSSCNSISNAGSLTGVLEDCSGFRDFFFAAFASRICSRNAEDDLALVPGVLLLWDSFWDGDGVATSGIGLGTDGFFWANKELIEGRGLLGRAPTVLLACLGV